MVEACIACLPQGVRQQLARMQEGQADFLARLSEIRLRAGHHAALLLDGENMLLPQVCTRTELAGTLDALVGGSLYAHSHSLRQGYLHACGCRIGVAGRAVWEDGSIIGVSDVTSLCIRIPHVVEGAGRVAEELFDRLGGRCGILVYSPPGVGKTTLLRELARSISCGATARRVTLVDARGELYDDSFSSACQVDVLRGYPLAAGIELACRVLSPELLICDEIGSMAEAEAVLSVQGCGVPLIASAHARTAGELMARPPVALLLRQGVFAACIGIRRTAGGYDYSVTMTEDHASAVGETLLCCK